MNYSCMVGNFSHNLILRVQTVHDTNIRVGRMFDFSELQFRQSEMFENVVDCLKKTTKQ